MSRLGRWGRTGIVGVLLMTGCTLSLPPLPSPDFSNPEIHLIPDVPFYPQEYLQCGPASLASVLAFWGGDVGPGEISGRIYSGRLGGTLPFELEAEAERYVKDRPLKVRIYRGDPDLFRKELKAGRPLLVFVDLGFWVYRKGHFMVLVGYDDPRGGVLAHSGQNRETFIPHDTFRGRWERTGYWALSIVPEGEGEDAAGE